MRLVYLILGIIATATIGLGGGWVWGRQISSGQSLTSLLTPPSHAIFLSPLILTYSANAEGVISARTDTTITLEKEGQKLELFLAEGPGVTSFGELTDQGDHRFFDARELRIGDYIKGGISTALTGGMVAHAFERIQSQTSP